MTEHQDDFTTDAGKQDPEEQNTEPSPLNTGSPAPQDQLIPTEPSPTDGDGNLAAVSMEQTAEAEVQSEGKKEVSLWREVRTWLRDLTVAAVICILLIIYIAQPFRVEKTSMEPLLHDGDRILVNKITLAFDPIRRGDIVVLWNPRDPSESWIKRVIGLPGELVQIIDGIVHINGVPLEEPYIPAEERNPPKNSFPSRNAEWLAENYPERMDEFGLVPMEDWYDGPGKGVAMRVPRGYYFVAGDHRRFSMDSRDSIYTDGGGGPGLIPQKYIYGKAIFRYWPLNSVGFIPTPEYAKEQE